MSGPEPARPRRGWSLGVEAFDRLLSILDSDRETAGRRYESIRAKLAKLFEWRGCLDPQELADATIDRVARRLEDGVELRVRDPYTYFYGVAVNVLHEHWRSPARGAQPMEALGPHGPAAPEPPSPEASDRRLACLGECLEALLPESRQLLERYHRGEKGARIRARKEIAAALRIPQSALRLRAFRIRASLTVCIKSCEAGP